MKTIGVDFDGVVHNYREPVPGRKMGPPIPRAPEALWLLRKQGYQFVYWTLWARTAAGKKAVEDWLTYWKCPAAEVTDKKPDGILIDDKAIHFVDWPTTLKELTERLKHGQTT